MRRLVALYPRAWRERYAAEFDDLLADRPATLRDQLDIVLGAFDAWVHPQVAGQPVARSRREPQGRRVLGAATAVLGGTFLILAGAGMNGTKVNSELGYKVVDSALLALILGMALVSIAALARSGGMSRASGPAMAAGVAMLLGALGTALPWPFLGIGVFGFIGAGIAFGVIIALRDRQPLGIVVSIASLLMSGMNTEDERALLTIPLALAWILFGVADLRPASRPGPVIALERSGT